MIKEELEKRKNNLESLLATVNDEKTNHEAELIAVNQKLYDLGKPEVTPMFLDKIYETILDVVRDIDLTDGINCNFDIDYENRISMENIQFESDEDITREIYNEVKELFSEAECPEDEFGRTESDNHPVDKLQG